MLEIIDSDVTLRSKRELIENFIEQNLLQVEQDENISQAFESFVSTEKRKAVAVICQEERLDENHINSLLENYIFCDVMPREDEVAEALTWTPKIRERKDVRSRVYDRIRGVIDTFVNGMSGF